MKIFVVVKLATGDKAKLSGRQVKIYMFIPRSSHRTCSLKKDVLKNLPKFAGKHLCQSLSLTKVAGLTERLN